MTMGWRGLRHGSNRFEPRDSKESSRDCDELSATIDSGGSDLCGSGRASSRRGSRRLSACIVLA